MAKQSAGMTLADLERIIQEGAVMAAEKGSFITDEALKESFEKIRMGENKSHAFSGCAKKNCPS
jgi:ATP-dependent Zn protease